MTSILYEHGFARVAAVTIPTCPGQPEKNAHTIIKVCQDLAAQGVVVACFPELSITGASLEDLFLQDELLDKTEYAINRLCYASQDWPLLFFVGAPLRYGPKLFNCAVAICRGRVVGIVPKSFLTNYQEGKEKRYFQSGGMPLEHASPQGGPTLFGSHLASFGPQIFDIAQIPGLRVGVEIGEDAWVPHSPSTEAALSGATIICNLSAMPALMGQPQARKQYFLGRSQQNICAYLYANCGNGESSNDLAWDGQTLVCENGQLLAETKLFPDRWQAAISDIHLADLTNQRRRRNSFSDCGAGRLFTEVVLETKVSLGPRDLFDAYELSDGVHSVSEYLGDAEVELASELELLKALDSQPEPPESKTKSRSGAKDAAGAGRGEDEDFFFSEPGFPDFLDYPAEIVPHVWDVPGLEQLKRPIARFPFLPQPAEWEAQAEQAYQIQVYSLARRCQAIGQPKLVLGVSGGLDSTQALLVAVQTMEKLGRKRSDILAYTLPGFATSQGTKNNAHALCEALEVPCQEIDIRPAARQMLQDLGHPYAQGEAVYDVTFENVQAGLRADYLFRLANQHGGLVVGTGDLSELALGWCTYGVGDQISHYAVNPGLPKTLLQQLIRWVAEKQQFGEKCSAVLEAILAQEISPELIPGEADSQLQSTQDQIGPYELHDFFLYYLLRGMRPADTLFLAQQAWSDKTRGQWPQGITADQQHSYTPAELRYWLKQFLHRFGQAQYKRTCSPNGPKVSPAGSLSPRGDWQMPSDISLADWRLEQK